MKLGQCIRTAIKAKNQTRFHSLMLNLHTSYRLETYNPKKYAHGFCFAVLCCGYTLTDFPISIRLTSLALRQSNDCPSASKATLMDMDKYFMWIHYERLHNHNKAKHNKTVCIFLGIYCTRYKLTPQGQSAAKPETPLLVILSIVCKIDIKVHGYKWNPFFRKMKGTW